MSEIEGLKAKLEEAEQRASRAEARLAEREKTEVEKAENEEPATAEGATITNPANSDVGQRARLAAAAALAARGDRRALLEWATLREELNVARRNE